jgi:hypothetical protein
MRVSTVSAVVISGGMSVVVFIFGGHHSFTNAELATLAKLGCACLLYTTFDNIAGGSRIRLHRRSAVPPR